MKHVTIKDIAEALCLSTSTVSRALGDDKNIRRETKEKVLAAARQLGYNPNPVALNLKYGRTNTIGVIVPEMTTPFAAEVINGIQEILYPEGLKVIIAQSNEDPQTERENLRLMERFRVDGIIISLCDQFENREEYIRLQRQGIPLVFFDRVPGDLDVSKVRVDDYAKSFFLVEHLIRSGRKRIAHLQAPSSLYNATERAQGYKDALAKFRVPYDDSLVIKTGVTIDNGKEAAQRLLASGVSFDALFAFTDTLAIGAMNELRERHVRIPEEVAVASFSGTILSTIVNPRLTTVEQPLREMGRASAALALEKIRQPSAPNRTVVLDACIKLRASTETDDHSRQT